MNRAVFILIVTLRGAAAAQVTNGADDDQDPAAVGLRSGGQVGCSGVVASARVVLTAAHCVAGGALPEVVLDAVPGDGRAVATARRHPGFDARTFDADVAMLVLAEPTDVTPWPLATAAPPLGAEVRVIGYGRLDAGDATPARRRAGTSTIAEVEPDRIGLAAAPSQPCVGDSGGPVVLDDVLIALTSSGDPACSDGARATRVDRYLDDFIRPFLAATADGAAAPGARCWHDANCAGAACVIAADDPRVRYCAPACAGDADCPDGMACEADACTYTGPAPGALGSSCAGDGDCAGDRCERGVCTDACVTELPATCPDGFACVATMAGGDACFASDDAPGCGCASTDPSGLVVALFLVPLRRRVRCAHGRSPADPRRTPRAK